MAWVLARDGQEGKAKTDAASGSAASAGARYRGVGTLEHECPPTKREMLAMLDQLWAKLTRRQQEDCEECLAAARAYIQQADSTGIAAEFLKSFRNRKMRRGVRIDLEIRAGRAGVDDPEGA